MKCIPRWAFRRQVLGASLAVVVLCVVLAGCGSRRTPPPVNETRSEPPSTVQTENSRAETSVQTKPAAETDEGEGLAVAATPDDAAMDQATLETVGPQDARRGSTIRSGGIITEPLRQYFLVQHRLVFLNVQHAEQLYKAEHGALPKSHDEYMREIIQANSLELPELDPGWDYYYDATAGELKKRKIE